MSGWQLSLLIVGVVVVSEVTDCWRRLSKIHKEIVGLRRDTRDLHAVLLLVAQRLKHPLIVLHKDEPQVVRLEDDEVGMYRDPRGGGA